MNDTYENSYKHIHIYLILNLYFLCININVLKSLCNYQRNLNCGVTN